MRRWKQKPSYFVYGIDAKSSQNYAVPLTSGLAPFKLGDWVVWDYDLIGQHMMVVDVDMDCELVTCATKNWESIFPMDEVRKINHG